MKLVLILVLAGLMSACAPSGSGEASFCEATPTAIVSLQVGDRVDQTVALSELFKEQDAVTLEPNVATYWFHRYNSAYDVWCWNKVVKVDRTTKQVLSITEGQQ